MICIPFKVEHFGRFKVQPSQMALSAMVSAEQLAAIEQHSFARTGIAGGEIVGVSGVVERHPGVGEAWAFLAADSGPHFVAITRMVREFLGALDYRRVEITCDAEFEPAHRWARLLGFKLEAPRLRAFLPGGGDASLYALVRESCL